MVSYCFSCSKIHDLTNNKTLYISYNSNELRLQGSLFFTINRHHIEVVSRKEDAYCQYQVEYVSYMIHRTFFPTSSFMLSTQRVYFGGRQKIEKRRWSSHAGVTQYLMNARSGSIQYFTAADTTRTGNTSWHVPRATLSVSTVATKTLCRTKIFHTFCAPVPSTVVHSWILFLLLHAVVLVSVVYSLHVLTRMIGITNY